MKQKTKSFPSQTATPGRAITLTFRLRFHTNFGQAIFLTGNHELFGSGNLDQAVPLQYLNGEFWQVSLTLSPGAAPDTRITYNYFVREVDGSLTHDWGTDKIINPSSFTQNELLIIDSWNYAGFYENAFYTKPFKDILLRDNRPQQKAPTPGTVTHIFKVKAPLLAKGQTIFLVGNNTTLRDWNTNEPILLGRSADEDFFTAYLDLTHASFPITYKYGVYDLANHKFVRLEDGVGRTLHDAVAQNKLTILNDGFAVLPANTWKGAGIAIPVFSLRSEASFGVGEFTDLKLLVDWGRRAGFKLIQLLPINDTMATHTWTDSYPYAAISAFALHPLYLNLSKLASKANQPWLKKLEPERKRLNALDALDYEAVIKRKCAFVKKVFPSQKDETFASAGYQQFFEQNKHWLTPYAAFCYLRDKYGTADFNQWPQYSKYQAEEVAALVNSALEPISVGVASPSPQPSPPMGAREKKQREAHRGRLLVRDEIELQYFIQYHLHCQLQDATDYAHTHGIVVKGDLPIGIYRYGADAWQSPELYHMEVQAGAPPDPFAVKGQNWGFPTYNWDRMKADGFAWWKQRCEQMSYYFDAFRIDHILGFFRIWSIPMDAVEGILGYFVPAIPVALNEFNQRGIAFDRHRFVKPFITDQVLSEIFQKDVEQVKRQFLIPDGCGNYTLKSDFRTQRKVEHYFAGLADNPLNEKLKVGLYDLISNVILFEVEGSRGEQFHFRLGMEDTLSFKHLDPNTQAKLKDLYVNYFFRRQDDFWKREAMQKLPALKRVTNMLVCGEDLGMVPDCVPEVMRQLGLLSLEIQRMPKDPQQAFSYPRNAPYLSVVTPSTHDMSTIRGWWEEEDKRQLRKFYHDELGQSGEPASVCEPWINRAIVIQHLESPAMWSIFQLQDLLGIDEHLRRQNPADERINVPANPKNYWRYRMHLTLESLNQAQAFTEELREYIGNSGR